jgi:hypothetical protein
MKQVKIFYEASIPGLEENINKFLSESEKEINLIDIKFLDSGQPNDNSPIGMMAPPKKRFAAVAIYEVIPQDKWR